MAQKLITVILSLIVVGGLAWYFNKTYLQPSTGQKDEKIPQFAASPQSDVKTGGNLLYTTNLENKEIWQVNSQKEAKKLFTDADETEKLVKVSNLASFNYEVFAITSSENKPSSGKLIAIDLKTAKKRVLQRTFKIPLWWSVSADAKKIAFVNFSNVEEDYGYTLYVQSADGANLQEVVRLDTEIKLPSWDSGTNKIAFVKNIGNGSSLNVVDVNTNKVTEVKNFENKTIDWVSWQDAKLIFSVRDLGNTQEGVIEIINSNGQNLEKIADFSGGIANFIYLKSSEIGYLIGQYSSKVDDSATGQIYIKNLAEKAVPIQKGNQILGWLP